MMLLREHRQAGFTLVEAMIAMMILAVALMGAASMQTNAMVQSTRAKKITDSTYGAETWVEECLSSTIFSSDDEDIDPMYLDPPEQYESVVSSTGVSNHTVEYRIIPDTPLENLVTIQVVATPRGVTAAQAKQRQVLLSFVRSNRWN
ncbi:MAG: prepilin-type N-terminal cleavage/methylation domain-containing protein [Deltaproteobacteria bacterium]|nr:prepilin-type N-terminal cleavage/methylation domain-containing protein [Deltaproteobacteria bacterium]